jgi:carbon-monoxide dehydrogenase small subunit
MSEHRIELTVNGRREVATVESRLSLGDYLRTDAGCTGVHLGCEHGVCGACTVLVDDRSVRSCLMLAAQADGTAVITAEGLADADGTLHPVQQAMRDEFGVQCGFCTPGVVITLAAMTAAPAGATEDAMLAALSGHLCRCTGYQGMRRAVRRLAVTAGDIA